MTDSQELQIVAEVRAARCGACAEHLAVTLIDLVSDSDSDATTFSDGDPEHDDVECVCLFCSRRAGPGARLRHTRASSYREASNADLPPHRYGVFENVGDVEGEGEGAANASADDFLSACSSSAVSSSTSSAADTSFCSIELASCRDQDDEELCLRLELEDNDGREDGGEDEEEQRAAEDEDEELPPCGHDRWEDYLTDDAEEDEEEDEEEAVERHDAVGRESPSPASRDVMVVVDLVDSARRRS